jgi:alpha-D-xyloside xylohydrolase
LADVYKRWCAFGLLSSHSRLHGASSYRVPWLFDEAGETGPTASDVLRFFTKLKCRLMPYLCAAAVEAHETGVPMMRAMPLEYPGDPACDTLDRQYMLGERLLVAPIFASDGTVNYYLSPGRWTHFLSGEVVEGGRWQREQHGYLSLPLMVRPNTVLPVGTNEDRPDYDYAEGVTYHVFELEDGAAATARVPALDGSIETTVEARRVGARIEVSVQGASPTEGRQRWAVLLRGTKAVASVTGGIAKKDSLGTRILSGHDSQNLVIHL